MSKRSSSTYIQAVAWRRFAEQHPQEASAIKNLVRSIGLEMTGAKPQQIARMTSNTLYPQLRTLIALRALELRIDADDAIQLAVWIKTVCFVETCGRN